MVTINQISTSYSAPNFKNLRSTSVLLVISLLLTILAACGAKPRSVEDHIRSYFYESQSANGEQFVSWANTNLTDYSSRQIYRALYNEGKSQAEQGHPNMIVALNNAAQAWARDKGLSYRYGKWDTLHQEALSNLREVPNGPLRLWPTE